MSELLPDAHEIYKIITPIKLNPVYEFNFKETTDLNDIKNLNEFMKRLTKITHSCDILRFLKHNINCLYLLIKIIPFSKLLELVYEYDFLGNYWNEKLLEYILNKSEQRFKINFVIKSDNLYDDLISLNNSLSTRYNFTDCVYVKRLEKLASTLTFINLDEYYLDTNLIIHLASNSKYQNNYLPVFRLYPKVGTINFNQDIITNTFKDSSFVITETDIIFKSKENKLTFLIALNYFDSPEEIFFSETDNITCDPTTKLILCTPKAYQLFDLIDKKNITKIYNDYFDTSLPNYKWTTLKLKHINLNKGVNITRCYICKNSFDKEITFERYQDMCLDCAIFNYDKRVLTANLSGQVAFVTGIRQKIGYATALKLLRCGAKVIGTTRYPNATWYNFKLQPDFDDFKDRLIISKCDFLKIKNVNNLIKFIQEFNINILINNACQTIRPSIIYKDKIIRLEQILANSQYLLTNNLMNNMLTNILEPYNSKQLITINNYPDWNDSLLMLLSDHIKQNDIEFNQFLEVKDLNIKDDSSWNKTIDQVESGEIMEVNIINQIVPTLFINQLKGTMKKPSFIINVTALEGQFDTSKTGNHAHTNMCKAALNMLIRTMSEEKEKDQFVYSINPGFVSGVNPQFDHYPLSPDDAAARILDPIIQYYSGSPYPDDWVSIRNYKKNGW